MTDHRYAYPFDPTGELNDNLIVKESHVIDPPDYTDFYFVVPTIGPFFEHNLEVRHWPSGRILINGVDFILSYKFLGASRATAKPVYGAISILDRVISGVLEVTYQTIGGPWTIDENKAAELLSNAINNPRRTTWEQVVELPHAFPVIDHEWDLVDMVGASELKDSLDKITDALYDQIGNSTSGENHATNKSNPHEVTKAQVGLGSVDNFSTASFTEATDPSVANRFLTPQRAAQLIDSYIGNRLDSHISNVDNPHNVSKTQVGLSNVPNYRLADTSEAVDGTVDNRFVTPRRVHEAIEYVAIAALDDHKANVDNPHNVTAAQIGLDRVENYAVASDTVARDGSSQIHYMTPHGVMELLGSKVGAGVADHVASNDNPHNVTAAQVGLGNVPNYPMSGNTDAVDGVSKNVFMSPYHTKLLIDSSISDSNDAIVDLISDHTSDRTNPHRVTKDQVGLDRVENYAMSTTSDAIAATRADLYLSPKAASSLVDDRVSSAISLAFTDFVAEDSNLLEGMSVQQIKTMILSSIEPDITGLTNDLAALDQTVSTDRHDLNVHIQAKTNPHDVTKDQVGLSKVENYAVATAAEAESGTVSDKYMTPELVSTAVSFQTGAVVDEHASRNDNPHSVTKTQVGLGSVVDLPLATALQISDPESIDGYMTPKTTHSVVSTAVNELVSDVMTPRLDEIKDVASVLRLDVDGHVARVDNPHNVTKEQLDLGFVSNYPIANVAEAIDPAIDNRYMTPQRVSQAISSRVDSTIADIVSDAQSLDDRLTSHSENKDNPHNVTKAQVGLGLVENFAIASITEAKSDSLDNRYMSPRTTSIAIRNITNPMSSTIGQHDIELTDMRSDLDSLTDTTTLHTDNRNNPHEVTAEQVGAMPIDELQTELNNKLGILEQADDSAKLDGRTFSQVMGQTEAMVVDKIGIEMQMVVNVEEQGAATKSTIEYQKLADGTFTQPRWDALLAEGEVIANLKLSSVDGASGNIVSQTVVVAADRTTGEWKIRETSVLGEIEPMGRLIVDDETRTISIWRELRPDDGSMTVESSRLVDEFDLYGEEIEIVDTLPGPAVSSDAVGVGFAYRLAATIEEEFGLIAQDLETIG